MCGRPGGLMIFNVREGGKEGGEGKSRVSGYQVLVGGGRKGKGKEESGYFLHTCAEVVLGLRVERGVCESHWVCVIVGQQGCGSWQGGRPQKYGARRRWWKDVCSVEGDRAHQKTPQRISHVFSLGRGRATPVAGRNAPSVASICEETIGNGPWASADIPQRCGSPGPDLDPYISGCFLRESHEMRSHGSRRWALAI